MSVVFTGLGCQQLRSGQQSLADERNVEKLIASMPLYDIEEVFFMVEPRDASKSNGFDLQSYAAPFEGLAITEISPPALAQLISSADRVLSF